MPDEAPDEAKLILIKELVRARGAGRTSQRSR
jgi:hypothetical protein